MYSIEIIKLSLEEKEELTKAHFARAKPETTLEDLLDSNKNQTVCVLRQLKNIYEWKDIEKMVDFVSLIKKLNTLEDIEVPEQTFIEVNDDEYKLAVEVFKGSVKTGKVLGTGAEKISQIYQSFKEAKKV